MKTTLELIRKQNDMKATLKQKLERIEELISKMETNHFLLPDSWSDEVQMVLEDFSYKTYVSAPRSYGDKRYINLEIYVDGKITEIDFRGKEIKTQQTIGKKPVSVMDVLYYLEAIYKEKHSFENHDQGIRKLKEDLKGVRGYIKSYKKNEESILSQIRDAQKLAIKTK